ncbi:hypothetical protein WME77_27040 [Sorangium sp. So ce764]|uniref:hypothetical protein n=1 Tax=Sorangium sp. So ce764 TaxID=3133320 RepID=UPI003F627625
MAKLYVRGAGVIAALTCALAVESSADACAPPQPGLTGTLPDSGATYPGNAALFFFGYSISLEGVTVTVDDKPASLVRALDVPVAGQSFAARIEPPPSEGQAIVIEGDFCAPESCEVTRIELTAGAADAAAPKGPVGLSFDLYDHADFKSSGGDCRVDSDLAWWLTVDGVESAGASPVIYTIDAFRDDSFDEPLFSQSAFMGAASSTMAINRTAHVLDGADAPEALCFRARAIDAAGNAASETAHACRPCYYREDPATAEPADGPPAEPEWTAADVYPGGTCDPGTGAGGGGTTSSGAGGGTTSSGAGGGTTGSGTTSGGTTSSGAGGGTTGSGTTSGGTTSSGAGDDGAGDSDGGCHAAGGSRGNGPAGGAALALLACAALAGRRRR